MTSAAVPTSRTWVNEDRIFEKVMPSMFQTGFSVIAELVQNSYRAGATTIAMETKGGNFAIHDDGEGLADPYALRDLLVVGQSGFEQNPTVRQAEPAGMGLYSLLACCETLEIIVGTSEGGFRVSLDSHKWFNDGRYRATLFDRVEALDTGEGSRLGGLTLRAHTVRDLPLASLEHKAALFAVYARTIDITVDDKQVSPFHPDDHFCHRLTVQGVPVWWKPKSTRAMTTFNSTTYHPYLSVPDTADRYKGHIYVSWYGHRIVERVPWMKSSFACFVLVDEGTPFHPKLPDRQEIRQDGQWTSFIAALKEALFDAMLAMDDTFLCSETGMPYIDFMMSLDPGRFELEATVALYDQVIDIDDDIAPSWKTQRIALPTSEVAYCLDDTATIECLTTTGERYYWAQDDQGDTLGLRVGERGLKEQGCEFQALYNKAVLGVAIAQRGQDGPPLLLPAHIEPGKGKATRRLPNRTALVFDEADLLLDGSSWHLLHLKDVTVRLEYDRPDESEVEKVIEWTIHEGLFTHEEVRYYPGDQPMLYIGSALENIVHEGIPYLMFEPDWGDDSIERIEDDLRSTLQSMVDDLSRKVPLLRHPLDRQAMEAHPRTLIAIQFHRHQDDDDRQPTQATLTHRMPENLSEQERLLDALKQYAKNPPQVIYGDKDHPHRATEVRAYIDIT